MTDRKAPKAKQELDPESEAWNNIPWRKLRAGAFISHPEAHLPSKSAWQQQSSPQTPKLLMKSQAARLLAVRRVTQDNQGKKTAGIDGVKSVRPAQRLTMANHITPKNWKDTSQTVSVGCGYPSLARARSAL